FVPLRARPSVVRRVATCCVVSALSFGTALGQNGWAVSPTVVVPGARYSVLGAYPACSGGIKVADEVRRAFEGFGLRSPEDGTEPSRLSRTVGRLLDGLGLETMNQDFAECAEVCATIPLAATRVTSLLGYVTVVDGDRFEPTPFDRYQYYVHWEPEVDTTRLSGSGRLVCTTVRNWSRDERSVFLVVGYE